MNLNLMTLGFRLKDFPEIRDKYITGIMVWVAF